MWLAANPLSTTLEIDVIGGQGLFGSPAFLDDLRKLIGDIHAPAIVPAVLEPGGELLTSILIHHVHVKFALLAPAGERQIAAAEVSDRGTDWVWPKKEI